MSKCKVVDNYVTLRKIDKVCDMCIAKQNKNNNWCDCRKCNVKNYIKEYHMVRLRKTLFNTYALLEDDETKETFEVNYKDIAGIRVL